MRDVCSKLVIIVFAAFSLSGCGTIHSVFGARSPRMPELKMSAPADAETAIAQAIAEGRGHLDRGETGLAIEAFRRALSMGAPSAPALNGMGVAFARLGRYELAHRYFKEAAAIDPSDERYAANITRLNRSPAFAMRYPGDFAAAVMRSSAPKVERTAPALASTEQQPGRLTRVSGREYKLQTVAPTQAPLIRSAAAPTPFKPLVRIEFSKPAAFNANPAGESPASENRGVPAAPGRTTITNPHLGRTAAAGRGFRPAVRFPLKRSAPSQRAD